MLFLKEKSNNFHALFNGVIRLTQVTNQLS